MVILEELTEEAIQYLDPQYVQDMWVQQAVADTQMEDVSWSRYILVVESPSESERDANSTAVAPSATHLVLPDGTSLPKPPPVPVEAIPEPPAMPPSTETTVASDSHHSGNYSYKYHWNQDSQNFQSDKYQDRGHTTWSTTNPTWYSTDAGSQPSKQSDQSKSWSDYSWNTTNWSQDDQYQSKSKWPSKTTSTWSSSSKHESQDSKPQAQKDTSSSSYKKRTRQTETEPPEENIRAPLARIREPATTKQPAQTFQDNQEACLGDFYIPEQDYDHLKILSPRDVPKSLIRRIGKLFAAAQVSAAMHVTNIRTHDALPGTVQLALQGMKGPKFEPPNRDDSTIYLFHGTSLAGAVGILQERQLKIMPNNSKGHCNAIYGKGCLLTGHAETDIDSVIKAVQQMRDFPKNQSNVIFQLQATGTHHTFKSGGVSAEEDFLATHPKHLVHMKTSSVNRWTIHPTNGRIKCMWILGDVWDFQDYDPWTNQ